MIHEVRTVKREIRILGIDACRNGMIVGAIVRGGLYLDGVMTFPRLDDGRVAERIRKSRYYPELRLIMVHDPKLRINTRKLCKETALPLIEIANTGSRRGEDYTRFERKNSVIYARSTLNLQLIRQVIDRSWTIDNLPEPVRVAHVLVNSISSQRSER